MEKKFGYLAENKDRTYPLVSVDGEYSNMLMNVTVYHLLEGEEKEFFFQTEEMAILLVEGGVEYHFNDKVKVADRQSFIKDGVYCLHISSKNTVKIKATRKSEILVQTTENEANFGSHFYEPSDCILAETGEGIFENKARRIIRTIFDYSNAPYSNMVMGEVITEQGGWSSYTPHHHPQPEVYYYRYEREEGFGACFIGEEAYKIKDKSFSAIPGGLTHPQVTAPGFPMYYCWMIRHLPNDPWTRRVDDERYLWLLEK